MAHGVPVAGGPPPLGPEGFDWSAWHADPVVVGGLALLGGVYLIATLKRRQIDPAARLEPARCVSFYAALAVLLGSLTGPVHDLSDYYLFSAHMVQHLILAFAMPPLPLFGTPAFMLQPFLRSPRVV